MPSWIALMVNGPFQALTHSTPSGRSSCLNVRRMKKPSGFLANQRASVFSAVVELKYYFISDIFFVSLKSPACIL